MRRLISQLDPFREEIARLLDRDARIPGKRVRELITELGYEGSKTILDDYLRELRPLYLRRRTYQRASSPATARSRRLPISCCWKRYAAAAARGPTSRSDRLSATTP